MIWALFCMCRGFTLSFPRTIWERRDLVSQRISLATELIKNRCCSLERIFLIWVLCCNHLDTSPAPVLQCPDNEVLARKDLATSSLYWPGPKRKLFPERSKRVRELSLWGSSREEEIESPMGLGVGVPGTRRTSWLFTPSLLGWQARIRVMGPPWPSLLISGDSGRRI